MPKKDSATEEILASVRRAGKRITNPKKTVAEVLTSNHGHLSAEDITAKVQKLAPEVSTSTVYRILEEFESLGLVVHSHIGQPAAVYHLAELIHGHLTCEKCGVTIEVPISEFTALASSLASHYDFAVNIHHVGLAGICGSCSAKD